MLHLKDAKHLLLGAGALEIGTPAVNVGMLKGNVTFDHTVTPGEVKGGFPQQVVKKYKSEEKVTLSASLAEFSKENVQLLLGCGAGDILGGGGTDDMPSVSNIVFTHEREGDMTVVVRIHKGKVVSGFKPTFSETDLALLDFQIEAEADPTKPKGRQLYEIELYGSAKAEAEALGTGDGTKKTFNLAHFPVLTGSEVYLTVGGIPAQTADYTLDRATGAISFSTAPATGKAVVCTYWYKVVA